MAGILIIEDDEIVAAVLARSLHQSGHEVSIIVSSQQVVLTGLQQQADLVILAARQPDLDGISLLRAWRANEGSTRLPVVLLAKGTSDKDLATGLEAGADWVLSKPIRLTTIVATIERVLVEQGGERAKAL